MCYHFSRNLLIALWLGTCMHLSAQVPDAAEDIRPPKALVEIPQPEKPPVAMWIGAGAAALALVIAAVLWKRRRQRTLRKSPPDIALASLDALERNHGGLSAELFADRAAQTVRQYVLDRFGLAAPRRTTEEFLRDIETSPLLGESDHLRHFLKSCDLAKFAGSNLDSSQRGDLIQAARGFVRSTAADPKPQTLTP